VKVKRASVEKLIERVQCVLHIPFTGDASARDIDTAMKLGAGECFCQNRFAIFGYTCHVLKVNVHAVQYVQQKIGTNYLANYIVQSGLELMVYLQLLTNRTCFYIPLDGKVHN